MGTAVRAGNLWREAYLQKQKGLVLYCSWWGFCLSLAISSNFLSSGPVSLGLLWINFLFNLTNIDWVTLVTEKDQKLVGPSTIQYSCFISLRFSWLFLPPDARFIPSLVSWWLGEPWVSQPPRTISRISCCGPPWRVKKLSQNPLTTFSPHLTNLRFYHLSMCEPVSVTIWMPCADWLGPKFLNQTLARIMGLLLDQLV